MEPGACARALTRSRSPRLVMVVVSWLATRGRSQAGRCCGVSGPIKICHEFTPFPLSNRTHAEMAAYVFAPCEGAGPLTDRSTLFICHDESDAAARVTRKALVQHRTIRAAAPPNHCSLAAPTSTDVAVVAVEAQSVLGVSVAGTVTPAHLCRGSDAGSTSSSLDESGSGGGSSDGLPPPKRRRAAVTAHDAAADGARRGNWVSDWIPSEQGRASGVRPAGAASWQAGGKGPVWEAEERERRGYAQQERAQSQVLRHLPAPSLYPPCTLLTTSLQ